MEPPIKHRYHSNLHPSPWKQLWISTPETSIYHTYNIVGYQEKWLKALQLRLSLSKSLCYILFCEHQLHLLNCNNVSSINGCQRPDVPLVVTCSFYAVIQFILYYYPHASFIFGWRRNWRLRSLFCDHELFLFVRLTTSWKVHETWQIENDVAPM